MNETQQELLAEQLRKMQQTLDANNAMLMSIQRRAKMSIIFAALKWVIILGITFGSFIFIQPYLEKVFSAYSSLGDLGELQKNMQNANTGENQAEGLINAFKAYIPSSE